MDLLQGFKVIRNVGREGTVTWEGGERLIRSAEKIYPNYLEYGKTSVMTGPTSEELALEESDVKERSVRVDKLKPKQLHRERIFEATLRPRVFPLSHAEGEALVAELEDVYDDEIERSTRDCDEDFRVSSRTQFIRFVVKVCNTGM